MAASSPHNGNCISQQQRTLVLLDSLEESYHPLPDPGHLARQQLRRSRRTIQGAFANAVEQPLPPVWTAHTRLMKLRAHLAGIAGSSEVERFVEHKYARRIDELSLLALDQYAAATPGLQQFIPLPEPESDLRRGQTSLSPPPDLLGRLDRLAIQQRFAPVSQFERFQPAAPQSQPQLQNQHSLPVNGGGVSVGGGSSFVSASRRFPQQLRQPQQQQQPFQQHPQNQHHPSFSREPPALAPSNRSTKRTRRSEDDREFENGFSDARSDAFSSRIGAPDGSHSLADMMGDRVSADGNTFDPPADSSFISGTRKLAQDMAKSGIGGGGVSSRLAGTSFGNNNNPRRVAAASGQQGLQQQLPQQQQALGGIAGTVTRAVLGARRRRFQPPRPLGADRDDDHGGRGQGQPGARSSAGSGGGGSRVAPNNNVGGGGDEDGSGGSGNYPDTEKGRLIKLCVEERGMDEKLVMAIVNDMCDDAVEVKWSDIAGLEFAKRTINEIIVWPLQRPDLFHGLRGPPKGILLYGPPGTGKTLIGKAIAYETKARFFSISASSLTSKWHGEGEKLVKTLMAVATVCQPAIIFIDEIDALLTKRQDGEFEATRRIKTEFLVQLDGTRTGAEDRVVVVGATNRPQELDEAARRRLSKRLYIPLPEAATREQLISNLLRKMNHNITKEQLESICTRTKGYSGADLKLLCTEAAFGPIRDLGMDISHVDPDSVRPISLPDFKDALRSVRASVSPDELQHYRSWNDMYGSFPTPPLEDELAAERKDNDDDW